MGWINFWGVLIEALAVVLGVTNVILFRLPHAGTDSYGSQSGRWIEVHAFTLANQAFTLFPLTLLTVLSIPDGVVWATLYFLVAIALPILAPFAYIRKLRATTIGPAWLQRFAAGRSLARDVMAVTAGGIGAWP